MRCIAMPSAAAGGRARAVVASCRARDAIDDADRAGDAVAVAVEVLPRCAKPAPVEVVAHPRAEVAQRRARERVARREVLEHGDLARRRAGVAGAQSSTAATRSAASGSAVVDEVVERAEHEVEQVDVVAHVARQQPAGERERARATRLRRRARPRRGRALTRRPPGAARPRRPTSPAVTSAPSSTPGMPAPGMRPAADVVEPAQPRSRLGGRK